MSFTTREKIPRCGNAHDIAVSLAPIAVMVGVPLIVWLLAGCTPDHQQIPGAIRCQGKSQLAAQGGLGPFAAGNGIISFDCGNGASISWGPPPQSLP